MIRYTNIIKQLSDAGWTAYKLTKEHLLSSSTLQRLRDGESISTDSIDVICKLLGCQPGNIMEYVPERKGEE